MIFIPLIVLFSFTSFNSLNAMNWFGYWTEANYQKHMAFIMAYTTLSFKIVQQEESFITCVNPFNKNNICTWSLGEAQIALNTILTNIHAGFPTLLKNDIIQSKEKEYFAPPELSKKQLSISEVYNLFCAFLQWQSKQDETNNEDYAALNRKLLHRALYIKDTNQLKKLELKETVADDSDRLFRKLIQDYTREETNRIAMTHSEQIQQPSWFISQASNYFPTIH